MKKNKIVSLIALTVTSTVVLSGCSLAEKIPGYNLVYDAQNYAGSVSTAGAGSGEATVNVLMSGEEAIIYAEETGTYSDSEIKMLKLEYKMDNEGLTEAEYGELASLYEELGFVKCERDILELEYCLFGKAEVLDKLKGISVNLAEEDMAVSAEMNIILFDLSMPERLAEVVHSIEGDEWFENLMPRLKEGKRTYYREKNGVVDFSLEVGYNDAGELESTVRFLPAGALGDTTGLIISRTGDVIKVYSETGSAAGKAADIGSGSGEKGFVLCTIDKGTGTVTTEEGTLKAGKLTGAYKAVISVSENDSEVKQSAFDLYNNRETLPGEEYTGEFDDNGVTTLAAPSDKNVKALAAGAGSETAVVYAYNADKTKCLYKGVSVTEKEAGVSFGNSSLDLPSSPEIQCYDTKDKSSYSIEGIVKTVNGTDGDDNSADNAVVSAEAPAYISEGDLKVRIYGGEIQVYNGYSWITMGDAREIAQADPFENTAVSDDSGSNGSGSDSSSSSGSEGTGSQGGTQVASGKQSAGVGTLTADTQVASSGGNKKGNTSSGSSNTGSSSSGNSGSKTGTASGSSSGASGAASGGQSSSSGSTPAQNSQPSTPVVNNPEPNTPANNNPAPATPDPAPQDPTPATPDPGQQNPAPSDGGNNGGDNGGGNGGTPDNGGDTDVEYSPDID